MDKYINFEISRNKYGEGIISTNSKYADNSDKEILFCSHNMYEKMEQLAEKYNNHPEGCLGVTFTMA